MKSKENEIVQKNESAENKAGDGEREAASNLSNDAFSDKKTWSQLTRNDNTTSSGANSSDKSTLVFDDTIYEKARDQFNNANADKGRDIDSYEKAPGKIGQGGESGNGADGSDKVKHAPSDLDGGRNVAKSFDGLEKNLADNLQNKDLAEQIKKSGTFEQAKVKLGQAAGSDGIDAKNTNLVDELKKSGLFEESKVKLGQGNGSEDKDTHNKDIVEELTKSGQFEESKVKLGENHGTDMQNSGEKLKEALKDAGYLDFENKEKIGKLPEDLKNNAENIKELLKAAGIEHSNLLLNPLSQTDRDAFDKNADGSEKGFSIFEHKNTVEESLEKKVVERMSPEERQRYDQEEAKLAQYRKDVAAWSMSTVIPPPPMPEHPATEMHDEAERRVQQAERKIRDEIRSNMSPAERDQFDKEEAAYNQERSRGIRNPAGTGEFREPPVPGPVMRVYYERIRNAAARY